MNNDEKVRVSLEQAIEVQNALRRNGLTLRDLKILTSDLNMSTALMMLRHSIRDLTEEQVLSSPLKEVFTEKVFAELGLVSQKAYARKMVLKRLLHALFCQNIYYVRDLVTKREAELLRFPDIGEISLMCVKEVLKKHDLCLGMNLHIGG